MLLQVNILSELILSNVYMCVNIFLIVNIILFFLQLVASINPISNQSKSVRMSKVTVRSEIICLIIGCWQSSKSGNCGFERG